AAYRMAAFAFLTIPFTSLLRGVFQGTEDMKPTAYSQVGEQTVRVLVIIFSAAAVAFAGKNLYGIGKMAGYASIFGAVAAMIILIFFWARCRPKKESAGRLSWRYCWRTLA